MTDPTTARTPSLDRRGLALGAAAYVWWGALPLYLALLDPAGPFEIIAQRIVWSLVFCLILLAFTRGLRGWSRILHTPRLLATLAIAAVLVCVNWSVYVYGVTTDRVLDTSLGYFINPLVTVVLAVVVLREKLRPAQWVALGIGFGAVLVICLGVDQFPWIALSLATSFGLYGLVKNRVGREVASLPGLATETLLLTPFAIGYLLWLDAAGRGTFADSTGHALLLVAAGIVTAVPLLLFGEAARRLPLSVVGMLQYLAPLLQFLAGLFVFHEQMPTARWIGFGLVWLALFVLTADALRTARVSRVQGIQL